MAVERTLSIIKPDAVEKKKVGAILAMLEEAGFSVLALKRVKLSKENPMNAGARGEVAEAFGAMGDVLVKAGNKQPALAAYQEAIAILTALEREGKANSISRLEMERVREAARKLGS